jgi:hypothetical protein
VFHLVKKIIWQHSKRLTKIIAAKSNMISKHYSGSETFSLPADRLGISHTVGILVLVLAITALVFLFLDTRFRSAADQEECLQLVRALGLNSLSLAPSGRFLRNPGAINPSIDLRFDPKLGRIPIDGADFVLKVRTQK